MRLGIYPGKFNPFHWAHFTTAQYALKDAKLDLIFIQPTPNAPTDFTREKVQDYAPLVHRREMVRLGISSAPNMVMSDFEPRFDGVNFTSTMMRHLQFVFSKHEIVLVMGEDEFKILDTWKDGEFIKTFEICSVPRPEPTISSTKVRELIRAKEETLSLIRPEVREYIDKHRLYLQDE